MRQQSGCAFEVSVAPVEGDTPYRKGLEALVIGLYRQHYRRSPTVNFGRMPFGYRMSSGNTQRLVETGQRFRGGPTTTNDTSHLPSMAPVGSFTADPVALDWCQHAWSAWSLLEAGSLHVPPEAIGLYRIRAAGALDVAYIGQGVIASRLRAHLAKRLDPDHRQGQLFVRTGALEYSFVRFRDLYSHQLLELENDLIAAYVPFHGAPPAAQFLG